MQIHEITKLGKKRTDEGILDTFKQAVGITPKPGEGPTKFQKMTNPSLAAVEKNKKALGPAADSIAKLKAQGYDVSSAEDALSGYSQASTPQAAAAKMQDAESILKQAMQEIQQDQQAQAKIQTVSQEFDKEFVPLLPDPGTQLEVSMNNGTYYKTDKGVWVQKETNARITNPSSVTALDDLLDKGSGKQVKVTPPVVDTKGKQKAPVKESILREARKTLAQTEFEKFVAPKVAGKDNVGNPVTFNDVIQNPMMRKRLKDIFVQMYQANNATPPNLEAVKNGFKQYLTVALAGIKVVAKQRDNGDDSQVGDETQADDSQQPNIDTSDDVVKQIAQTLSKVPARKRKSTVKKAFKQANSGGV